VYSSSVAWSVISVPEPKEGPGAGAEGRITPGPRDPTGTHSAAGPPESTLQKPARLCLRGPPTDENKKRTIRSQSQEPGAVDRVTKRRLRRNAVHAG